MIVLEHEGRQLLENMGIKCVPGYFCETEAQLVEAAITLGYPVVLKIVSPDVIHKTDFGGVRLNIDSESKLIEEYYAMISQIQHMLPSAKIYGVLVVKQVDPQVELIVGSTKDPQFGPIVMVGLGGIFVEVFRDLSFGIAPIEKKEAEKMLQSLQAYSILTGARGKQPVNMEEVTDLIVKVSKMVMEQNVVEMDLNPVFCVDDQILVGDVRIITK